MGSTWFAAWARKGRTRLVVAWLMLGVTTGCAAWHQINYVAQTQAPPSTAVDDSLYRRLFMMSPDSLTPAQHEWLAAERTRRQAAERAKRRHSLVEPVLAVALIAGLVTLAVMFSGFSRYAL
ncbi:MAG TPA: hypothetical protein VFK69_12415 [Candidatus Eisenbacteria bacterium]|nr:hypothetical protein [Candidatus Eisenbacteria bacterium]